MSSFLTRIFESAPKLEAWRLHLRDAERSVKKLRDACAPALEHSTLLAAAWVDLKSNPSPALCRSVMALHAQEASAAVAANALQGQISAEKNARIAAGRDKFLAAVAETRASLEAARAKIVSEDAARSADLGEPVESSGPLETIQRKLDQLDRAVSYSTVDLENSRGALRNVVGGEA